MAGNDKWPGMTKGRPTPVERPLFENARKSAFLMPHQPSPPPGHPTAVSYGWPGGGEGWCGYAPRGAFKTADQLIRWARALRSLRAPSIAAL